MRKKKLSAALLMVCCALSARAAGIECPEAGAGDASLPPSEARLLTQGSGIDISNEIGELIAILKAKHPGISYAGLTNAALAAYCPLVANAPSLDSRQKLNWIRKLDKLVREQLSSEITPQDYSILAQVPLSQEVYRALRVKAEDAGQTPSQYMAALLNKAAGEGKGQ
jgi:hypothetical protein